MKNTYSAFLLVLIGFSLFAGDIKINPTKKTQLQVLENSYSVLKLKNTIGEIEYSIVKYEYGNFTKLSLGDYGKSMIPGEPELPVFKTLIEIPLDAEIEIKFSGSSAKEIDLTEFGISGVVIPARGPVSKEFDQQVVNFVKDEELYSTNQFYGQDLVRVEILGNMRGVRIARLEIAPVKYNPVLNKLQVFDDLEIEIAFKNGDIMLTEMQKKNLFSPYIESIYSSVLNHKPIPVDELITNAPITYVIVADPMFESSLEPFVEWKSKKGYRVVEAYTNDPLVGNTTTSIKAYLESLYNDPPQGYHPQSFILLVGDVGQIPSFDGVFGFHPADLYYAEYTGDMFPDCFYGRFSANDVSELLPQINKTIEYEKYEFPSPEFLDSALLVAGVANGLDTIWGNGQISYAAEMYINEEHGISAFVYPQPEPSGQNYSDLILEKFNNGISYFNYTGHCRLFWLH
ncbi:MAG: C25 family cysteine peptidase [Bacteroidales bacterium]